jgi:hypothetical protein
MLERNVNERAIAIDRFLRPPLIGAPVPRGVKSPPELGTLELPAPQLFEEAPDGDNDRVPWCD